MPPLNSCVDTAVASDAYYIPAASCPGLRWWIGRVRVIAAGADPTTAQGRTVKYTIQVDVDQNEVVLNAIGQIVSVVQAQQQQLTQLQTPPMYTPPSDSTPLLATSKPVSE